MSGSTVDLGLIARQPPHLMTDVASLPDHVAPLATVAMRKDGTFSAVPTGVRPMHSQHSRLANRVRRLEEAGPGAQP